MFYRSCTGKGRLCRIHASATKTYTARTQLVEKAEAV